MSDQQKSENHSLDLIHAMGEHVQIVSDIQRELVEIARAARTMGNEALYHTLTEICHELNTSAEKVSSAHGYHVCQSASDAEQFCNNMMAAALLSCVGADNEDIVSAFNRERK